MSRVYSLSGWCLFSLAVALFVVGNLAIPNPVQAATITFQQCLINCQKDYPPGTDCNTVCDMYNTNCSTDCTNPSGTCFYASGCPSGCGLGNSRCVNFCSCFVDNSPANGPTCYCSTNF